MQSCCMHLHAIRLCVHIQVYEHKCVVIAITKTRCGAAWSVSFESKSELDYFFLHFYVHFHFQNAYKSGICVYVREFRCNYFIVKKKTGTMWVLVVTVASERRANVKFIVCALLFHQINILLLRFLAHCAPILALSLSKIRIAHL